MKNFWNPLVNNLKPYIPGEQPQDQLYIKLNTNENPYPPSPKVLAAIKLAANERLRLYPDPECTELKNAIASYHGLSPEQVFVGNGSDEVLAFSFLAFFDPDQTILFPDITYSFYPVYAAIFRNNYHTVPLRDDYTLPIDTIPHKNGGVIFPNPNAPTGISLPLISIENLLQKNKDSVVIIDEAYIAFGAESADKLINSYQQLLIIRTMSKSHSLAGLRCGYAIGNKILIEGLNRIKSSINSYTLDRLALAGGLEAIKDTLHLERTSKKIISTRDRVAAKLRELGFQVLPSDANFLFISHSILKAEELYSQLKLHGILVRFFNAPRINNHLRVSIGTDDEMDLFLHKINDICSSK